MDRLLIGLLALGLLAICILGGAFDDGPALQVTPPRVGITLVRSGRVQAGSQDLKVPGISPSVLLADWDADGDRDLLLSNYSMHPEEGNSYLFVSLNAGDDISPECSEPARIETDEGPIAVGMGGCPITLDWDGDGLQDVLLAGYNMLQLYLNEGTAEEPSFGSPQDVARQMPFSQVDFGYAVPCIADWNQDGIADLLVSAGGTRGTAFIYAFFGTAESPMQFDSRYEMLEAGGSLIQEGYNNAPVVVDWDSDGRDDLVLARDVNMLVHFYWARNVGSNAAPRLSDVEEIQVAHQAGFNGIRQVAVCDWNGDGVHDILAGTRDGYVDVFTGVTDP